LKQNKWEHLATFKTCNHTFTKNQTASKAAKFII